MKMCSTCKEEKDNLSFTKDKRMRNGLRSQCKSCHKKTSDAWREANKDKIKENTKNHYLKNREYYLEKGRNQWKNLDESKKRERNEYHKEYYKSNREHYLNRQKDKRQLLTEEERTQNYLRQKEYYEAHKETIKQRSRERLKNLSQEQKQQRVERVKEFRHKNREKATAWSAVGNAILRGELEKPSYCELCGVSGMKIHAHHEDYSKPLEVLWLCHDCHMSLHSRIKHEKITRSIENEST